MYFLTHPTPPTGVRRFDFDSGLAPYSLAAAHVWSQLSCFITADHISKLAPVSGNISIVGEGVEGELIPRTPAEHRLAEQLERGRAAKLQRAGGQQQPTQAAAGGPGAQDAMAVDSHTSGAPTQQETPGSCAMETDTPATGPASTARTPQQQTQQGAQQPAASTSGGGSGGGRCFYTHLPRLLKQQGATAAELTEWNLDKSKLLEQVCCAH